jgi:hypothetical protein
MTRSALPPIQLLSISLPGIELPGIELPGIELPRGIVCRERPSFLASKQN